MVLRRSLLVALLPVLSQAGTGVPNLEELGSDWVAFGTGATVPTKFGPEAIPIDCPSISNVAGSVGSCEPGCPDLLSFNSWTAGPFLQGTCAARMSLDGVPVNVTRHQWLPHQVVRQGTAGRFSFTSAMRLLDDGAGTPGILLNLTVTPTDVTTDQQASSNLTLTLAPELQLLDDMPWNINWPPPKAGWTHTVEGDLQNRVLVSSDTTTEAVAAVGVQAARGGLQIPISIIAPDQQSVGLGAHGPAASISFPLTGAEGPTTLTVFVVATNSSAEALTIANSLSEPGAFDRAWSDSRERWGTRWKQAFEPNNPHCACLSAKFLGISLWSRPDTSHCCLLRGACACDCVCAVSGHLPTLTVADEQDASAAAVRRIYYAGCLTLLACERSNYPMISPRVYLTGFGTLQPFMGKYAFHGGSAAFYWDQSLLSSLNTLLDPQWMKDFLIAALHGGDFSTNLFVEMLNAKPSGGYWYAFNTISVFWSEYMLKPSSTHRSDVFDVTLLARHTSLEAQFRSSLLA